MQGGATRRHVNEPISLAQSREADIISLQRAVGFRGTGYLKCPILGQSGLERYRSDHRRPNLKAERSGFSIPSFAELFFSYVLRRRRRRYRERPAASSPGTRRRDIC